MDATIKAKWVEALRSGKYQQGRNTLRSRQSAGEDHFCCLGVLCDLVNPRGWNHLPPRPPPGDTCDVFHNNRSSTLPQSVIDIVHICSLEQDALINMNDGGNSFEEIADYIEENL